VADVVAFGEMLIDFEAAGGAPANVAAGLARLGVSSAFMGMVGDDPFGAFLADALVGVGVDVSTVRFSSEARTALAFVSLREDGEREFLFYRSPSADMLMRPEDVDSGAIRAARVFHFGSISLIADPSRASTLHAVRGAREAGLLVTYDPNLRLALWPDAEAARQGMRLGLAEADVVKIGDEELAFLTGCNDPVAAARSIWTTRTRLIAITRGKAGCLWLTASAQGAVPGFAVVTVDATGAGDAFTAGLISGLVRTQGIPQNPSEIDQICRFANAVGALTTTGRGAIPSLPARAAVNAFLSEQAQ